MNFAQYETVKNVASGFVEPSWTFCLGCMFGQTNKVIVVQAFFFFS